ncbi:Wzz/FepE/Etk N-terminal domain-containing protein [Cysteiniphilum halobium]|uniref:Wzz/FepE/Etk N-terminal domain-containing protein n=1 Tax=Cysteiniphilum halobium TaxID=2219059 RepID=UPI003F82E03E
MSQLDNDIISISDLLVTLTKHIKLWVALVAIGVVLSVLYGFMHKDNYEYSAYILGPSYIDGGQVQRVMNDNEFSKLVNIYYKQYLDIDNSSYVDLLRKIHFDPDKSQISIKAKKDERKQVNELFNQLISYIQSQQQYIGHINNWQVNVEFNLKNLQQQNKTYGDVVKQFQHNMSVSTQFKGLATLDGQALLNSLSNTILSYQNQMFHNDIQIQHYKSQLQTLNKKISILGGVTRSYNPVGLTSPIIAVLGIILSLILATIIVFIVEFAKNLRQEVKQKLHK